MYKYAKIYYYEHSNLDIPTRFKTNNGYDYDKNGDYINFWISSKDAYKDVRTFINE